MSPACLQDTRISVSIVLLVGVSWQLRSVFSNVSSTVQVGLPRGSSIMQLSLIRRLKVEGVCMSRVRVAPRVSKMNQILSCDWLSERGDVGLSCPLRIALVSRKKMVSSTVSRHMNMQNKTDLDHCPAILTSHLINNS